MLHYILQVLFFQLCFLMIYEVLLKKETFFNYNRVYLLLTPVLAFLLPFLKLESLSGLVSPKSLVLLPEVFISQTPEAAKIAIPAGGAEAALQINWWILIYLLGSGTGIILFFRKYLALKKLFQFKVVSEEKNWKLIEVPNSRLACTFYQTVFLGDRFSGHEKQYILSHELVHVKQKHSLDLVFFEILKVIFWFNPLVYVYQSKLAGLHEFIADAQVVKNTGTRSYYQQLLNTAFNTEHISFINQFFNHSLIKKRIIMLQKSKSKTIAKFKFLILVPLMLGMLMYVSCSETVIEENEESHQLKEVVVPKNEERNNNPNGKLANQNIKDVPFAVIEEVPVYPGCEGLGSNNARKECLSEKITAHVNKNFDTSLGKELGLSGINRIYVQFRINKNGLIEVIGARAPRPELEEEARRVVNALPTLTPGKQKGENVGVLYSLPITFNAGE